MPLLLQARITSVSFEEARYRHYRARQRRDGALQKAVTQVKKRAPSPFDEDAAQATRRLFARTVAQVVEIHALERTFDAWRNLEVRPKAPPSLPARPPSKYDPRALDLGARLAEQLHIVAPVLRVHLVVRLAAADWILPVNVDAVKVRPPEHVHHPVDELRAPAGVLAAAGKVVALGPAAKRELELNVRVALAQHLERAHVARVAAAVPQQEREMKATAEALQSAREWIPWLKRKLLF